MQAPTEFSRIIDRKRYDVKTATLIAHNAFWDGHNWERRGRNIFLYRTPKGNYFQVTLTKWEGEQDGLEPLSQDVAILLYERDLPEHPVEYTEAFPDVQIEDA